MRRRARTDWFALRREAESALRRSDELPSSVRIDGRLRRLEGGLNHENYLFCVEADGPLPWPKDNAVVLRRLRRGHLYDSDDEALAHVENEGRVLEALASQKLRFSVPRVVCFLGETGTRPIGLIETWVPGLPLDFRRGDSSKGPSSIDAIGRSAAEIHRSPLDGFRFLPQHVDSRAHVLERLDGLPLDALQEDAASAEAITWVREHLPQDRPPVLLHGDLLPQNVLENWETGEVGVVDWEYARIGDPAYDLAIVTRGRRKLLGCSDGLRRLVEAYRNAGGAAINHADVVLHELLLALGLLVEAIRDDREDTRHGYPPEHCRDMLKRLLRRAEALRAE